MTSNFMFLDKILPCSGGADDSTTLLNILKAVSQEVNFSQVLQEALLSTIHREEK